MNQNLLIVGAGIYGVVAKEIAESMNCFEKIDFVDDHANGVSVIGTTADLDELATDYSYLIVAIGDPKIRLSLLNKVEEETLFKIATLISPRAYVSPSAQIMKGSIIEPMAVVHTGAIISKGCIISAGAVINHASMCCDACHIDCNAVVAGQTIVPAGTKVCSGEVFRKTSVQMSDFFMNKNRKTTIPHGPVETETLKYTFEDGM